MKTVKGNFFGIVLMNQQYTQVLQKLYTSRKHLLVFVDDEEYEEFEYLKSVKGNFFLIVYEESAI